MGVWKVGGGALGRAELNILTDGRQIVSPEGLKNFCRKCPQTQVVSHDPYSHGWVTRVCAESGYTDHGPEGRNEKAYIIPGQGAFGERT